MLLRFPNLRTLDLAITAGLISDAVLRTGVEAAVDDEGGWCVRPQRKPGRARLVDLQRLGVRQLPRTTAPLQFYRHWMEFYPLTPEPDSTSDAQNVVLFEVRPPEHAAALVSEIVRLGNDRLGLRFLADQAGPMSLVRVVDPPYYSMLRAAEADVGEGEAAPLVAAYRERSPGVWVEAGFRHRHQDRLQPRSGKLLLVSRSGWREFEEGTFQDVYQTARCTVPGAEMRPSESPWREPLEIPLRLAPATSTAAAEFWVLTDEPLGQVEMLLAGASESLAAQLLFAVLDGPDEKTTIVLRARPSREAPPLLELDGAAYRAILHLPNLFAPLGRRLQPPLRREAIVERLCPDPRRITWLQPEAGGGFTPHSIEDAAFRPLSDWVRYIVDREHQAVQAWRDSHRFDFESFVCRDAEEAKPAKSSPRPREPSGKTGPEETPLLWGDEPLPAQAAKSRPPGKLQLAGRAPSDLQLRLQELEQRFRELPDPPDSPRRIPLWRALAATQLQLGHAQDATLSWTGALWEQDPPSGDDLRGWWECEAQLAGWGRQVMAAPASRLQRRHEAPQTVRAIAAYCHAAAFGGVADADARRHLAAYSAFLAEHEACLPIRAAWLAWRAVHELSGDELLLARVRDRLLRRLFQEGLRPEVELPRFLRGQSASGSFRQSEPLRALLEKAKPWAERFSQTWNYAQLMFAVGLARVGDAAGARACRETALEALVGRDGVHRWLSDAFDYRIEEALRGEPPSASLPVRLLDQLRQMERLEVYRVDRLRQHSRMLEPHQRVEPYRRWHRRFADDLHRSLTDIRDLTDDELARQRLEDLLRQTAGGEGLERVLLCCLELGPRLGEEFSLAAWEKLAANPDAAPDALVRAMLLLRGMQLAGHFDWTDRVQTALGLLDLSLPEMVREYMQVNVKFRPEAKERIALFEELFEHSFWGLRKLGMGGPMSQTYERLAELLEAETKIEHDDAARRHRMLLCCAAGWYLLRRGEQASAVADEVRDILHANRLPPPQQKDLACAYVHASAQAPSGEGAARIAEVFDVDEKGRRVIDGVTDALTTSSHFSLYQLEVVEASVLALVGGDAGLTPEASRWLDDDEFCIRRRIHRDVAAACRP